MEEISAINVLNRNEDPQYTRLLQNYKKSNNPAGKKKKKTFLNNQIANEHMKKCSAPLVVKEMQIKTTM